MNGYERRLFSAAHKLGAKVTQPVHLSYTIELPEGMTLETFVREMARRLEPPASLNIPPEISAMAELGWDGRPVKP